jgi:broad specificity polyphosphatase/5'/3'-nucleotidase SurE
MPADVGVLKVEVPANATTETPWEVVRVGQHRYFVPRSRRSELLDAPGPVEYVIEVSPEEVDVDTDIYTLRFAQKVAVTPLSLDLTARVSLPELDRLLRQD